MKFLPLPASEAVNGFEHMQIQTRIGVIENEVGHVLEAVPDGKMSGDVKIHPDM